MQPTRSITAGAIVVLAFVVVPGGTPSEARGVAPQGLQAAMQRFNVQLAARGENFRIEMADWFGGPDTMAVGQTVFANDRGNKQVPIHWVPADPRRGAFLDIAYIVDRVDGGTASGLTADDTVPAIDRAMDTWDAQQCSDIPITDLGDFDVDLGFVQFLAGLGGFPAVFADVTHAGWLPGVFFDLLEPGGSDFILGATITFIFVDAVGNPTDIDGDGKFDAAFREIYYNDEFFWAIDANVDVETVVLHESGHGLSQAHFGKIFITERNNRVHFAPRAVMNALYSGPQQELRSTDNGGHCSIWGSWPNQ